MSTNSRRGAALSTFVSKTLGPKLLKRSGVVFYSSPESLVDAECLFVGLNPGGDPNEKVRSTIKADLSSPPERGSNRYETEAWAGHGRSRLQTRVSALLERLGCDPRRMYFSNVFFVRSRSAADLRGSLTDTDRSAHMKVWARFLEHCPARRVVCLGVSTWRELRQIAGLTEVKVKKLSTKHPGAAARLVVASKDGATYQIAVIPHLSRFDVGEDSKLVKAFRSHLGV